MRAVIALVTIASLVLPGTALAQTQIVKEQAKAKAQEKKPEGGNATGSQDAAAAKDKLSGRGGGDKAGAKDKVTGRGGDATRSGAGQQDDDSHAGAIAGGIAVAAIVGGVAIKKAGGKDKEPAPASTTAATGSAAGKSAAAGASGPSFGTLDANKDGKLAKDEFLGGLAESFKKADANGDGVVSRAEAVAAYGERGGMYFDALDVDKKGAVSQDALNGDAIQAFAWADANRDGIVTIDEATKGAAENEAVEQQNAAAQKADPKGSPLSKANKLKRAIK